MTSRSTSRGGVVQLDCPSENADWIKAVHAQFMARMAELGQVLAGFRPGDRVEIRIPGQDLVAFGEVAGYECRREIGEQAVRLDGTGQMVRVPEGYLRKEGAI